MTMNGINFDCKNTEACIYITDGAVTLGSLVDHVAVHPDGTVDVVSKVHYTPALIFSGATDSMELRPRPVVATSSPCGTVIGVSAVSGKEFRIDTSREYVNAAVRQGVPITEAQ